MAVPITIPRLGWNMEEGTFGGWLKADGDPVRAGDTLFTLESEKATEEVEGLDAGFLRIPASGPRPGDRLAVGTVIGYVVASRDEVVASEPLGTGPGVATEPDPVASPAVRRLARERGIDLRAVRGTGPGGRISADDLRPTALAGRDGPRPGRPRSSPRARRAARELGIDWSTIPGTGRGGRVRERDIRATGDAGATLVPITPFRRTIAARMLESLRTTAPVTLTTTVDATNLVRVRDGLRGGAGPTPSFTDLLVKLAAGAIEAHPILGGRWTEHGIQLPAAIHIGLAVDTGAGLVVPVVRDVLKHGIYDLANRTRELIERARAGRLTGADMQGGCFTVTNLGAFGVDAFTPIINVPESAILGVGRIARRPAVVGDTVVPRDQVTLSLTFDHRVVDGAPAARFLQTLARAVEQPDPWIEPGAAHEE
jgi:pyruvate dehydrogenase E2 component (dihydrolipoamide acetyltransferase)